MNQHFPRIPAGIHQSAVGGADPRRDQGYRIVQLCLLYEHFPGVDTPINLSSACAGNPTGKLWSPNASHIPAVFQPSRITHLPGNSADGVIYRISIRNRIA